MNPHEERHEKLRWFLSGPPEDPLGDLAVKEGFVTPEQLEECRRDRNDRSLAEVFLEKGFVSGSALEALKDIERVMLAGKSTVLDAPGGAPPAVVGRKIGRYRLVELLGEGGMGVVFRAADDELGREVALKMLKTAQAYSASQIERFQREARNTARLRHPGIATLYEIGREDDTIFISLELIPGKPFDPKAGSLHERVALLEKVARAVQYAHEQGVLHRDLKPGNILVDREGAPHLLDFGLSRDLESPGELTRSGAYFGTPAYSAPEQAEGRVRELDERTDVYALGAILYECLTGEAPFSGETIAEILKHVTTEEAPRPAGPPELVTICLKAMDKERPRRYPSAGEMADDLARFLRGEPVRAKPISHAERLRRAARKHRAVLVASSLAVLLLAVTALWVARETGFLGGPTPLVVDDFERTPQGWKYVGGEEFPGAKGSLTLDDATAHSGRHSYRITADFTIGGAYVGAWRTAPYVDGRDLREFRFWVKTPDLARLSIRVSDATEQVHQKEINLAPTTEWQEVILPIGELIGGERWGGAKDGRWHGPLKAFGINVGRNSFKEPCVVQGSVWIDDISMVLSDGREP